MKKLLCVILLLAVCVSTFSVEAAESVTYLFWLREDNMSGDNYEVFLIGCDGHYSKQDDSVTVYITNTGKTEGEFEVLCGYSGSKVQTDISSGKVKIKPNVSAKFVLENLSKTPEKANDDLGYVPDVYLSGKSVIRIRVNGLEAGDSFKVTGMKISNVRNINYSSMDYGGYEKVVFDVSAINGAKKVISDESDFKDETESFGTTMEQPSQKQITAFVTFIAVSAAFFIGGVAIYICSMILKRRDDK